MARVGEVFAGRYELVDLMGSGGMGSVWRVWDHRDRRYVAAKVLGQADAASLLRFLREQSHRVQHPHVVTPMSWAGEDDRVLFTMALVRGGSVATLVGDHGALPASWAGTLLDQLLDALGAVHAAGLVHRDVKPSNLLLEPTGTRRPHLRLSDFGLAIAVHLDRLTLAGQVVGTPGYLAPEVLTGAPPDPRQDLYAAGRAAAAMLLGAPVPAETPVADEPPPGCPNRLWWIIRSLSELDPAQRPPSAAAARAALQAELPTWTDTHDVEVFDQMPPLPAGWTEGGPGARRAGVSPGPAGPRPAERLRDTGAVARTRWPAVLLGVAGVALILLAIALLAG